MRYNPQKYGSNVVKFNGLENQTHKIQWGKNPNLLEKSVHSDSTMNLLREPLRDLDYYFALSREMLDTETFF